MYAPVATPLSTTADTSRATLMARFGDFGISGRATLITAPIPMTLQRVPNPGR